MSLRQKIMSALKDAMLNKRERETATLRMVIAKMRERDIEARPGGNHDGISDADILSMLEGMVKQRRDSIALYQQGGRADLAKQEQEEIDIITGYLPQKLDAAAVDRAIAEIIASLSATGIKDMSRVMAALKEKYAGQIDFGAASARVKEKLS